MVSGRSDGVPSPDSSRGWGSAIVPFRTVTALRALLIGAQQTVFRLQTCLGIQMAHRNMTARDMSPEESRVLPFPSHQGDARTICVFCGSSRGAKADYAEAARQLG